MFCSQIVVHKDHYKIIKGEPLYYSMEHLGDKYGNWFCGRCGSTVGRDASPFPDIRVVKLGTLDNIEDINNFKPVREVYTDARVAWIPEFPNCSSTPTISMDLPGRKGNQY